MSENLTQTMLNDTNALMKSKCHLYRAYKNFAQSRASITTNISPEGIAKLEFIGSDWQIKCNAVSLLDGVSLCYGSYTGDFSKLKYGFDCPSVHFGMLQNGHYEGMLDSKPFSVREREVFLVAPDTHTMGANANTHCNCVQIDIDIMQAKRDLGAFLPSFSIEAFYEFLAQNPLVATSCLNMRSLLNSLCEIQNIDLLRLKVCEALLFMWQSAHSLAKCSECGKYSKSAYVRRVVEYLEAHYNASYEEVSLKALGERFSVCVSKLTSDFREVKGISLYQYLKQCKIANACQLLKMGKSVSQVANEVGYINVSAFCKNFREIVGVSPNKFAKNAS